MRVLKIISDIDVSMELPEDAEVIEISLGDYLNTKYEQRFDMILCVHALQHLWSSQIPNAIEKLVKDLAHMGELHIHVPAIEHPAKSLMTSNASPISMYMIWGTMSNPNHSGFTLLWIRAMVQEAGAIIRRANIGSYKITFNKEEVQIPEHVIIATVIDD